MREKVSAPITSAVRAWPSRSALSAVASAKMKPGADRLYVKGGAAVHAELRLHLGRGRREGVVRGRGGEHDQIEVAAAHPRIGEGAFGGAHREVGGQLALGRDAPLADPGALADPFVGGVETRGKLVDW